MITSLKHRLGAVAVILMAASVSMGQNWPQGDGPDGGYVAKGRALASWSVVHDKNIAWTQQMAETGQSTVTIYGDRIYYTCYAPVAKSSTIASTVIVFCAEAATGKVLWEKPIEAKYPLRLSGCFSDSTSPPVVVTGEQVCVFNASGTIACFDMAGKPLWQIESMAVGRSQPFVIDGRVIYIRQIYMPKDGKFGHENKNAPKDKWTNLVALDLKTGKASWTSECGVGMGAIPMAQKLVDGTAVIGVGRGGGHGPPEKPLGVSLVNGADGKTLWTLPLPGFMSTQTYPVRNDQLLVFHGPEHLWVNAKTGKIDKQVNFCIDVSVRKWDGKAYGDATQKLKFKKTRAITQQSNLRVGDYHYFRAYQHNYLGRIHLETGKVEYLELPVQLVREKDKADVKVWRLKDKAFQRADMKNNNGFVVMGDKRSMSNTWGHHASPIMTAVGDHLYLPTLVGTVYCIKWNAEKLDENAIVAINDLGPAGPTWSRASLSYSNGRLYAHTIKQLICIGSN
jgi:outer membrane protein assembly factor BamB